MDDWSPETWKSKPIAQGVVYPDADRLNEVLCQLRQLPPLVTSGEVELLKSQLADAAGGNRFLLQGGDCAERFEDCESDRIASKLKILLKMSIILMYGTKKGIVRVGRFAGQYAKPRSAETETRDGLTLPCYRGQLINRPGFTVADRTPDPELLLRGYERSAMTLNFIRGLVDGGFADLRHPELWDMGFVDYAALSADYQRIVRSIGDAMSFLEAIAERRLGELKRVDFFAGHEGLHLDYEQAHTRRVPRRAGWYNLNAHMPWLGDRTRAIGGAHVEYFRGIVNPIGIKIGPTITPEELVELIDILNPHDEPGRLTLIHRFGVKEIEPCLPGLIEAVQRAGRTVLWCCDPMHGNTRLTQSGVKTRLFDDILGELDHAFDLHQQFGSYLGGVHFELTGEDVTECLGGARNLSELDLTRAYLSDVDPRLNYEQSLEMALLIARRASQR